VAGEIYLFERVTILHRNFAIGSDVSGDVINITFKDGIIGDESGSSPWAIKLKTDSQEGGIVDGIKFLNLTIGNITYCGSSAFVYNPPHSAYSFLRY
jgi:polygalacturonase